MKFFSKSSKIAATTATLEPDLSNSKDTPAANASSPAHTSPNTPEFTLLDSDLAALDLTDNNNTISPNRRTRIKTMANSATSTQVTDDDMTDASNATSMRMARNTDSMLQDVTISNNLKLRLAARREQFTKKSLVAKNDLSKFVLEQLAGGGLDAIASASSTPEHAENAADLAIRAAMEGYFSNVPGAKVTALHTAPHTAPQQPPPLLPLFPYSLCSR